MPINNSRSSRPAQSAPVRQSAQRKTDTKKSKTTVKNRQDQKKKKLVMKGQMKIPKTAQESVPFEAAYANGIIESARGLYSKTYKLSDINFKDAPEEDQEDIFSTYEGFINSFDSSTHLEITINNRNVDEKTLKDDLMCQFQGDSADVLRKELNEILTMRMSEGKNNIVSDKYLTLSIEAEEVKTASNAFASRIDKEVDMQMKKMAGRQTISTPPMKIEERIKCLHDIFNIENEEQLPEKFNLRDYLEQGMGVKDIIAPPAIKFSEDHFQTGDMFGQVLYAKTLPTQLSTDFIAEMSDMPFNLTASVHLAPIEQKTAVDLVRRQMVVINGNVMEAQKKASREGYGADLISPELRTSQEQASYLMDDIRTKNQRLFFGTIVIAHYANSFEALKENSKRLISLGNRYMVGISRLNFQQELGFATALPLGNNELHVKRLLKTESAALFIPFSSQEIMEKDGISYGVNALSRNLLMLNRASKKAKNANGLILGESGTGKSVTAKLEMLGVMLTKGPNNQIFVIDPDGEYVKMAVLLAEMGVDATVVHIQPGSGIYINPLDMDMGYGQSDDSQENPLVMKSDFIASFFSVAGNRQLSNTELSIIDRVVGILYADYITHMETMAKGETIDIEASPTLDSLFATLLEQPEEEAHYLALAIERYAKGSFDCFANTTNVRTDAKFVVYDIKDIGTNAKELGLQVCLDNVWNKTISNKKQNIRTWIYLDEFHIIAKSESASHYVRQIWKRARKWMGVPCAITQNLEDMLQSEGSRAILGNVEFVIMLSQAPLDREGLKKLYKISDSQLQYITNSSYGQGLIYNGRFIVPFENIIPEDTKIFKIVSTRANTAEEDATENDTQTA